MTRLPSSRRINQLATRATYATFALLAGTSLASGLPAIAGTHKAICSYYTRYEPCRVTVTPSLVEANLPTDFLSVDSSNYLDTKIYDDTGRESNHAIGTATTILLGPIGLLGFLATKRSGTVDFGVEFRDERGKKRTAFIRFVNMRAAEDFGNDLKSFLKSMERDAKPMNSSLFLQKPQ